MYSYINDDRGATEPYTDLPAIALVSVGILLFGYLMTSAYFTYATCAYYAQETDDLRVLAMSIAGDSAVAVDGCSDVLDAKKLDDSRTMADMALRYGHPGSQVEIRVNAGSHTWYAGESGQGVSACYRLPVSVMLNDATTLPGFLTVTCREG